MWPTKGVPLRLWCVAASSVPMTAWEGKGGDPLAGRHRARLERRVLGFSMLSTKMGRITGANRWMQSRSFFHFQVLRSKRNEYDWVRTKLEYTKSGIMVVPEVQLGLENHVSPAVGTMAIPGLLEREPRK